MFLASVSLMTESMFLRSDLHSCVFMSVCSCVCVCGGGGGGECWCVRSFVRVCVFYWRGYGPR